VAHHQRAAGRKPLDEIVEHRAVCLCAAEEVEMVGLDVGHHRDVRGVLEQEPSLSSASATKQSPLP
jgi:hypothetical protein